MKRPPLSVRRGVLAVVTAAIVLAPTAAFGNQQDDGSTIVRPAAAALPNPLVPGTYAGDTPAGPVVVVFSASGFTDPEEEDWDIATALLPGASSMRVTDGGDASAATWTTVLDGASVLVLPEGDNWFPGGSSAISDEALEVIRTWVSAGRTIVGTGSYTHGAIVSALTGVDFTSAFGNNDSNGPWQRVGGDTSLPAELPNGNYTGGLGEVSAYSPEQLAVITPLYSSATNDSIGIAEFAIGTGKYVYHAYDWYPDSGELENGVRDIWNGALGIAAGTSTPPEEEEEEPELAETGTDILSLGFGAAALLLLAGGAVAFATNRRPIGARR
ncbi:MAG: hypothetical protein LDL15_01930 [Yonghaparkia sp.]|nr:hypothetical protein [Microcella sp.]